MERNKSRGQRSQGHAKPTTITTKSDAKSVPNSSNLWRERQLRDYRKANNLCYSCGEKYDLGHKAKCPNHKLPATAQVNALVLNDLDTIFEEDVLNQLAVDDALAVDFCHLSLNALSGSEGDYYIRVRALV